MLTNPFHRRASSLAVHAAEQHEHEATVELLVLAEFADRMITNDERTTIEAFVDAHGGDTPTFNFASYQAVAVAKVRNVLGSEGDEDVLLADISGRIVHTDLRADLRRVLADLLPKDDALSVRIRAAFAS